MKKALRVAGLIFLLGGIVAFFLEAILAGLIALIIGFIFLLISNNATSEVKQSDI